MQHKVSLIIMVCSILVIIFVGILAKKGLYIQVGGIYYYEINFVLTIVIVLSSLFWLVSIIKLKELKVILIMLGIFFIIIRAIFTKVVYVEVNHTRFTSPNGNQEFLVIESSSSKVYQKTDNSYLIKHLGDIRTKRRFQTFYTGNYQIDWTEPGVMKVYYKNKASNKEYSTEYIEYVENNG